MQDKLEKGDQYSFEYLDPSIYAGFWGRRPFVDFVFPSKLNDDVNVATKSKGMPRQLKHIQGYTGRVVKEPNRDKGIKGNDVFEVKVKGSIFKIKRQHLVFHEAARYDEEEGSGKEILPPVEDAKPPTEAMPKLSRISKSVARRSARSAAAVPINRNVFVSHVIDATSSTIPFCECQGIPPRHGHKN